MKNTDFNSDVAVINPKEDRFKRYPFAKHIADTISKRSDKACIIYGLYGAWGMGKSTVLNFIEFTLKEDDNINLIKFNPWRYNNEESLLLNFFNEVAKVMERKLKNRRDEVAETVKKYGALGKFIGFNLSDLGDTIADTTLKDFKQRVNEILAQTSKKLVIIIDDIDRLDKKELAMLFRLVKLTGDFQNTTYILSFDKDMVAAAIGDQFGGGDGKSGESFLEKIIQISLDIPKAQPEDLKEFCLELLNKVLIDNNIDIEQDEIDRFYYQLNMNILPSLTTPRTAVRYVNAVSFALPMLLGEVNVIDLMLIEALRIFYPHHHEFIKNAPELVLGDFDADSVYAVYARRYQKRQETLRIALEDLGKDIPPQERKNIEGVLTNLFPSIKKVLKNARFSLENPNEGIESKRISFPQYFERYFSYAVIDGDISDIEFSLFLRSIDELDADMLYKSLNDFIEASSLRVLIGKLEVFRHEINWQIKERIIISFAQMADRFDKKGSIMLFMRNSSLKRVIGMTYTFLSTLPQEKDLLPVCLLIVKNSNSIEYDREFFRWLNRTVRTDHGEAKLSLNHIDLDAIRKSILDKALEKSADSNLFEKFPDEAYFLIYSMAAINQRKAINYVEQFLNERKENIEIFLLAFCPVMTSSAYPKPYKGDLSLKTMPEILAVVDINTVKDRLANHFGMENINKEQAIWDKETGNREGINVARQFLALYKEMET